MSKESSEYVAAFDYLDKALIVLSATIGAVSIVSFATICYWCACRNSKCKF